VVETDTLLRHIRHAEEWLRCARGDYRRGDRRAALLRLLLAEAEIHHARESAAGVHAEPAARPRRGRLPAAIVAAAAALVLASIWYQAVVRTGTMSESPARGFASAATGDVSVEMGGPVRLDTGGLLNTVPPFAEGPPERLPAPAYRTVRGGPARPAAVPYPPLSTWVGGSVTLVMPGDPATPSAAF
jgi:hypothetical protein